MKKLFFTLFVIIILFSCEEKSKIEIIKNMDSEYVDVNKRFIIKRDGTPLLDTQNKVEWPKFIADTTKEATLYRIYVSKTGEIQRIKLLHDGFSEIDRKNVKLIENWTIEPFKIDNKFVNAKFDVGRTNYNKFKGSKNGDVYFVAVEKMPEPIGGGAAIQKNVIYPELAKRAGVQGRVFVKAFIDALGNVVNTELIRGIGSGCDEAAMEAVKKVKFTPGTQRGKSVKVQLTIPILFKLDDTASNGKSSKPQKNFEVVVVPTELKGLSTLQGGIVSEKDGDPIVAANIILEGTRLGCASDHLGAFMITKIPPGEYALIVSAPNYGKQKIGKVIMRPNKTTVVALKIKKE